MFETVSIYGRRIAFPLINAFLIMPAITILSFVVYMQENKFFSYDFFAEGIFGMKLFFLVSFLMILMLSIFIYLPLIIYFMRRKNVNIPKIYYLHSGYLSLLSWVGIFAAGFRHGNFGYLIFVFVLCSLMAAIIISYCFSTRAQIYAAATVYVSAFLMVVINPGHTERFVGTGLKEFGIGGDIDVSISRYSVSAEKDKDEYLEGKLKLVSPNYLYIIPKYEDENYGGIATVSRDHVELFIVSNK